MKVNVNWTTIVLTAITTLGTVVSAFFANRARGSAATAKVSAVVAVEHADIAKEASLRPPPSGAQ